MKSDQKKLSFDYDCCVDVDDSISGSCSDADSLQSPADEKDSSSSGEEFDNDDDSFELKKVSKVEIKLNWKRNYGYFIQMAPESSPSAEPQLLAPLDAQKLIAEYLRVGKAIEEKIDLDVIRMKVNRILSAFEFVQIPIEDDNEDDDNEDENDEISRNPLDAGNYLQSYCSTIANKLRDHNTVGLAQSNVEKTIQWKVKQARKIQDSISATQKMRDFQVANRQKFERVRKRIDELANHMIRVSCDVSVNWFSLRLDSIHSIARLLADPVEVKVKKIKFDDKTFLTGDFSSAFLCLQEHLAIINVKLVGQSLEFNFMQHSGKNNNPMYWDKDAQSSLNTTTQKEYSLLFVDLNWVLTTEILEVYSNTSSFKPRKAASENEGKVLPRFRECVKLRNHVTAIITDNPLVEFESSRGLAVRKQTVFPNIYLDEFQFLGIHDNISYIHTRVFKDTQSALGYFSFLLTSSIDSCAAEPRQVTIFQEYKTFLDVYFERTFVFLTQAVLSEEFDRQGTLAKWDKFTTDSFLEEMVHSKAILIFSIIAFQKRIHHALSFSPSATLWDLYIS